MKKGSAVIIGLAAMGITLWGCKGGAESKAVGNAGPAKPAVQAQAAALLQGTVMETMDSGGYTYVKMDTGKEQIWAAGPPSQVKVGDQLTIPASMPMHNFHAESLNRDFETIYLVGAFSGGDASAPAGAGPDMGMAPPGHPQMGMGTGTPAAEKVDIKAGSIKKAKDGKTVAEVFQEKAQLAGKKVTIRARVVKFTPEVMGKNWLHIQDGTGAAGSNDLTVTTTQKAGKGDTVLVTGTLALDKDFGYGYKYDLILEDATVKVE